jgi:RNA polymerase sigma factor (sigma-70 family)
MVWGVCRRILRNYHNAEDAFQATFLVLVRKAVSVLPREMVANWLHGVAHQTALKARATVARRQARERQVATMPEPAGKEQDLWYDLQPLLDEELSRLPDKYRAVLVLCDLEGNTRKEAARHLRVPEGTVAGRLARARTMLARRLARHGLPVSGGTLAAAVSQQAAAACVPCPVVSSTIRAASTYAAGKAAATGVISVKAAILTEGVLKAMLLSKLKTIAVGLLLVALLSGTAGALYQTHAAEQPKPQRVTQKAEKDKQPVAAKKDEKPKPDQERLQGTWTIVSTVVDGQKLKDGGEEVGNWTIKDTMLRIMSQPKDMKTGTGTEFFRFKLDEATKPRLIDLVGWDKEFDDADERKEGIYSIAGDTLRICINRKKGKRPTAFESKEGSTYILWTLHRERQKDEEKKGDETQDAERPKGEQRNKTADASTSQEVLPLKAADQREYVITSRLLEAGADQPKEVLGLPKVTVDDGQLVPIHIIDNPQNLLEKVVLDEKIKLGMFLDVRVRRLGGNKVRLILSFQRNEVERSSVSEIRVLGHNVQAIEDVELHKPARMVFQKDAAGSAQRWVEITVDEQTIPAPAVVPPLR